MRTSYVIGKNLSQLHFFDPKWNLAHLETRVEANKDYRNYKEILNLSKYEIVPNIANFIDAYKFQNQWRIIWIEISNDSRHLNEFKFHSWDLLVIWNEKNGVSNSTMELCDSLVEIPMKWESYLDWKNNPALNISACYWIALFKALSDINFFND